MVVLITGASHTGKTVLAQKLMESRQYPYLSIDHLKMGLIRSGNTALTPTSDEAALTDYLWGIVKEIVKTVIENKQNLVIEGCYIPFDWEKDFEDEYRSQIRFICLVMSDRYIETQFDQIKQYANVIEYRGADEDFTQEHMRKSNARMREHCQQYGAAYLLIDEDYQTDTALPEL